eukprot:2575219-Rhodomonas_salina.3
MCRFGSEETPGLYEKRTVFNPATGKTYAGLVLCTAPAFPNAPPAGVHWSRASLAVEEALGVSAASSEESSGVRRSGGAGALAACGVS